MNPMPFASLPGVIAAALFSFLSTDPVTPEEAAPTAKPSALATFEEAVSGFRGSDRFWTAPYLLADLESETLYVWGEHTGMIPGDPLEFFVISEKSGHDYEALMISFARPSNIALALEKMGLESIGPVDPDVHRFWPRGDRVAASFVFADPEGAGLREEPAEFFCIWKGDPMPPLPWVFTGAPLLPSRENEGAMVFAPDEFGPNSIASTFNLRATVFDLPLQGTKTGVYGEFLLNPEWKLAEGAPMILKLRPAPRESYPEEKSLTLQVTPEEHTLLGLEPFTTRDLAEVGSLLNSREKEIHFLTTDFSGDLTLKQATARAQEIQLLEKHVESIRIEPPVDGQVFFQSFVPDPRFRDRQNRPSQPLELHLEGETAAAVELEEVWGNSREPAIVETRTVLQSPEAWTSFVEEQENPRSVLFLFGPADTTLREMRRWTQPVLDRFPIVFVYKTGI